MNNPFADLSSTQNNFLLALVEADVEFVLVGGYAMRFHGRDRKAKDLDIVYCTERTNTHRLASIFPSIFNRTIKNPEVFMKQNGQYKIEDVDMRTLDTQKQFHEIQGRAIKANLRENEFLVASPTDLIEMHTIAIERESEKPGQNFKGDIEFLRRKIDG